MEKWGSNLPVVSRTAGVKKLPLIANDEDLKNIHEISLKIVNKLRNGFKQLTFCRYLLLKRYYLDKTSKIRENYRD
jgi:hypothetical protein